ncbi:MAG TPA: pyruvate:ferredoxin (flavodoxin) oxidoreductase [Balneolaceae bacterium]|nr:pyruvate:ferredoxin (flavodoxin) oxidoreductase [Balneolaceae bacterium]
MMKTDQTITVDANEAVARVAHAINEVIAIYPITPASPMGEWADAWSMGRKTNIWGDVPVVIEMQSEGGAAGTVHGALQSGALTTTFTASQGLLLMMPNLFKIAGELNPAVIHVAARSVATHALSIFGDHSDVMAVRMTGVAMLSSNSVQEAMDMALIAQTASLESRIPFIHFFDGFRTSHEIQKIEVVTEEMMREMISDDCVIAHRTRALSPDNPFIRGTAQNPDVFFQSKEAVNTYYEKCPGIVQDVMNRFAKLTGRHYRLFDYHGADDAEQVVVLMGSGAETVHETTDVLNEEGNKTGVIKVRLYRPFDAEALVKALPASVRSIAVLDRTKEPGSAGEPLYVDMVTALQEQLAIQKKRFDIKPRVSGGRYGLSSKEFTPSMIRSVFLELKKKEPKNHFTIGIYDDVTNTSLNFNGTPIRPKGNKFEALFYGLGSDGTVSANKNSIKIIGDHTDYKVQGYFVYDSKKAGATTTSHLRFGEEPIRSAYLIEEADFIGCHQPGFLEKPGFLTNIRQGGTLLLNAPWSKEKVWDFVPAEVQKQIVEKQLQFYMIDAYKVAKESGLADRINTVMQVCFFAVTDIIESKKAIGYIKDAIKKTYGRKGRDVTEANIRAVDNTLESLTEVDVKEYVKVYNRGTEGFRKQNRVVSDEAPEYVQDVIAEIISGRGDELPVSVFPVDGTFPSGTSQWEKRNLTQTIPVLDPDICIQCSKCVMVCPHSVIRVKAYDESLLEDAPATFKFMDSRGREWPDNTRISIQVSPEDCTGCELCVEVCPAKNREQVGLKALNMSPVEPLKEEEKANWDFFLNLPEYDRLELKTDSVKGSQYLQPLFEFSGACSGCGETPYIKLVTQLFGDRMIVANATGCSSIYGGNLPTTPWAKNSGGLGPAWSNSLFEDNAEFGLGFRITIDRQRDQALRLLKAENGKLSGELTDAITNADQTTEAGVFEQRKRVNELKSHLENSNGDSTRMLASLADYLVRKSVWIIGGDGWAYDIGYGGLDHVLASGKDVNILILDTEVYSNTGGQRSKATPLGAVAKFAAGGKESPKKDLGMVAMSSGHAYVARIALGADDTQALRAIIEAERFPGPSVIIAYSHCIAHGYNMKYGLSQQKLAVESGYWPLFRYNPSLVSRGENPFRLDSKPPKIPFEKYAYNELRYLVLKKSNPKTARELMKQAQQEVTQRWHLYEKMEKMYEPGN